MAKINVKDTQVAYGAIANTKQDIKRISHGEERSITAI